MKIFFLKKNQILKSLWSKGLTHKISAKLETIFFSFQRDPLVFLRFLKSHYAYINRLWQTEMKGQTSLTVKIVVSKDVWISKKIICEQVLGVGMTFHCAIWLKTRAGQKEPSPQVTTSFQSPGGIGFKENSLNNFF